EQLMKKELPRVSDYLNYREFLRDFYDAKKEASHAYSYRVFAQKADLGSSGHLKMVMDGQRNLTQETVRKYLKGLSLKNKKDVKLFELLVKYNQCKDPLEKVSLFNQVVSEKNRKGLSLLEKHQFQFLSSWYHIVIYVMADFEDFQPDPEWIRSKMLFRISQPQIETAIDDLKRLGLLVEENGRLKQAKGAITVPDEIKSTAIPKYHDSMLDLAKEALKNLPVDEREFNGVTLPICQSSLAYIKERIREFRKEINEYASNLESPDEVYQLNIQLLPMTRREK
ncbi:MAG: TIGR02147 family protein, partial [Bdellovibrionales bacterium]|nr:TIGR02147 family protein [Bdellovibrionales bacterium]